MKDEFIEASQDVDVLSKLCPEDLVSVKPEDVSFVHRLSIYSKFYATGISPQLITAYTAYLYAYSASLILSVAQRNAEIFYCQLTHSSLGIFFRKTCFEAILNSLAVFLNLLQSGLQVVHFTAF